MQKNARIYVAGHRGMVGSSIVKALKNRGYNNLIFRTSSELDLRNQNATHEFFEDQKPEYVFLAAAKVGGILANNLYRADFIYENLIMELNVIHAAHTSKVKKLMFFGSSCIYPKMAEQPLKETSLLSGYLESTNEPYAIAKIAGIKLCESYRRQYGDNFIAVMPTNLYGYNDNYHPQNSHVLPALIRRFHEAKVSGHESVEIWGTGTPRREFLFSDDLADACMMLMEDYNEELFVNVGSGEDLSIAELANTIKGVVGFKGNITFDTSKPDGTPRKRMDNSILKSMNWSPQVSLLDGIKNAYTDFKNRVL
jgi:GDP-L-fucose synthase